MYSSGSFIYFSEWKALALCFSMQSDRSQRLMRQVTFAHSYINCGEANPSITNTHSDTVGTAICGHLPFRRLQHWVSCPRTNWCVDRRGRESYRLSLKVEEPLYLLGNIEAELGGNVARPSDFETSSKMTRLQKKYLCFSQWSGNSVYCGTFSSNSFCYSRMLVSCPGVGQFPSFWNTLLFVFRSFTRSISSSS